MSPLLTKLSLACCLMLMMCGEAHAVRIMTNPVTSSADQFDNIALTPDGTKIVTTASFFPAATDRVYWLPVPANPTTDIATVSQLSTTGGAFSYDVAFPPVISPDGQTVLHIHDGNSLGVNTIYTMPITGQGGGPFTGLFGADPNLALPGDGNSHPIYSGTDIYFLNNNAGFQGAIPPPFSSSPVPYDTDPDWDMIYKRSSSGVVTAVTSPGDGDIDGGLFALTPNGSSIIFAPDNPVQVGTNRSDIRPKLFSIAASGGTATEIPITPPDHDFTFTNQLAVTPDGQKVLFISDYEAIGRNELFSVPITGGTPTRISDNIHWAGDVTSFAIAPNGLSAAYIAGQNSSAVSELFQTPITGGTGNSARVSDPVTANTGLYDVSTSAEGGQIAYSNDSSQIYYLGDTTTQDVTDLYVVDTTAKAGLVPSAFTYIGPSSGDFFTEANWQDADGNPAPANSINPGSPIRIPLIIDGDTVSTTANGLEADFQVGGSLEMTPGSVLDFSRLGNGLDFNRDSGLKLTDATIKVHQDIFLEGTNVLSGGLIESTNDDIEFQDYHKTSINGTTLRSTLDIIVFDNSATSVTGATLDIADRLSMRFEIDLTVTDTNINVRGFIPSSEPGCPGCGDVEDAFAGAQGEGSILTLEGDSTLLANAFQDGVSLVLDGTSMATLLGNPSTSVDLVDSSGSITFMSSGAVMSTLHASASDVRARIINGLTGLSYLADPSAWNVTNWDGISPLASLKLVGGLAGDFDGDGDVDGRDFLVWQRGGSLPGGPLSATDLSAWQMGYGSPLTANSSVVPEPHAVSLLFLSFAVWLGVRRREMN